MTAPHIRIGDVSPRAQYTADGVQTAFPYLFPIFETADMQVYLDGALQQGGYTVSGAGASDDQGLAVDAAVTFDAAPAAGTVVTLVRKVAVKRLTDFSESGDFRAKTINDELDRLVAMQQQVGGDAARALHLPVAAAADAGLPSLEPNRVLQVNSAADGFQFTDLAAGASVAFVNRIIESFTGDGTQTEFTLGADPGQDGNVDIFIDGAHLARAGWSRTGATVTLAEAPADGAGIEVRYGETAATAAVADGAIGGDKLAATVDLDGKALANLNLAGSFHFGGTKSAFDDTPAPYHGYGLYGQVDSAGTVHLDSYSTGGATQVSFGTNGGAGQPVVERLRLDHVSARPGVDNAMELGFASRRWKEVFAAAGAINTSDAREKEGGAVAALTAAEIAAAKALAREIGGYRFLSAVAAKGDAARRHVGVTVQRVVAVMNDHGLDPFAYGFVCHDQWDEGGPAGIEAADRYGLRPDEFLMFLAAGFEARLATLEDA